MNWELIYARLVFLPTLAWNVLLGRVLKLRHWWDSIDEHVILGARPFRSDVLKLAELGVGGIVNTCEEFSGFPDLYASLNIEQLYIPTVDFTPPAKDDILAAVDFMQRVIASGRKVYVHCKAGRGRSATVVAAYLMLQQGLSLDAAQRLLLERRAHVNRHLSERPVLKEISEQIAGDSRGTAGA